MNQNESAQKLTSHPFTSGHKPVHISVMPNDSDSPLPEGFIDDLFDQLSGSTRRHLIQHLCGLKSRVPSHQTTPSKEFDCGEEKSSTTKENDIKTQRPQSKQELQHLILSNITRIGKKFFSRSGHDLYHALLLCKLITPGRLCNLVELDLRLASSLTWRNCLISEDNDNGVESDVNIGINENNTKRSLLNDLHSLLPSLLHSLPQLKSFTLPKINYPSQSLFFSLPGLFPGGYQSCHLEKLSLSYSGLNKINFKYLALHSNHMFPSLTSLDVSQVNLAYIATDDPHSTAHYLLQWIERSMPKLTHLSIGSCYLKTAHIASDLANSPILSQLESLDLSDNSDVEADGWQALFASPQFTNSQGQDNSGEDLSGVDSHHAKLKTLNLNENPNIKSVIPLLSQNCPYLINLTTLGLDHCELDDSSIQSLCDSKWIRGLESLPLGFNFELTFESIRMIAGCDGMRNLTSLGLGWRPGPFSLDLLRSISQSQYVSRLTKIEIDLTGVLYDKSIDQLLLDFFHSPKASALTCLDLDCGNIPQTTMQSIVLSPMLCNLEIVLFSNQNHDNHQWIDAFLSSPNCRKLKSLTFHNCNLTDSDVLSISQSLHLSDLSILDLSNNRALTDESVKYLVQSEVVRLRELNLRLNPELTPLVFHHLMQSPRFLSVLRELFLTKCPLIGNEHCEILAKSGWFDGKVRTN